MAFERKQPNAVVSALVSFDEFRTTLEKALATTELKYSRMYRLRGHSKKKDMRLDLNAPLALCHFDLMVENEFGKYAMRVDHVLCALKMVGDIDTHGEKVLGGLLYRRDDEVRWQLAYAFDENDSCSEKNMGSIDHVVPKAKGGADHLYNMQMMRAGANNNKADKDTKAYVDAEATRQVLEEVFKAMGNVDMTKNVNVDFAKVVERELDSLDVWENENAS